MCSCPKSKKEACPLKGECLKNCIIYQATVTHTNTGHKETYIVMTKNLFKKRLATNTKAFNHIKYKTDIELSSYIWNLKEEKIQCNLTWKIIDRAKPFNPVAKTY